MQKIAVSKAGTPLTVELIRIDAYEGKVKFEGEFWISMETRTVFLTELQKLIAKYEI